MHGGGGSGGIGGGDGGAGGGGLHKAESPANSMLRPEAALPSPWCTTANVASTYPRRGGKNTCTDLLACRSVRLSGSLGLSSSVPLDVDENVPVRASPALVIEMPSDDATTLPEAGRSGVL